MEAFLRSFDGKSIEQTQAELDEMLGKELERISGTKNEWRIAHLQSSRGSELNGKLCKIVGCDPRAHADRRLQIKTLDGESLRIRPTNLCDTRLHSTQPSKSCLSADSLRKFANAALSARDHKDGTSPRDAFVLGQVGRYDFVRSLTGPTTGNPYQYCLADPTEDPDAYPAPVPCCGWNVLGCCDALPAKHRMIAEKMGAMRPGCNGDGLVHLERLAEGLVSTGDVTCAICLEAVNTGEGISSLPCGHQFHEKCIKPALEATHMACPICRSQIKSPPGDQFNSFALPVAHRIILRFVEFIDSGMCERCQMAILEKQQFGRATLPDGRTVMTVDGQFTDKEIGERIIRERHPE